MMNYDSFDQLRVSLLLVLSLFDYSLSVNRKLENNAPSTRAAVVFRQVSCLRKTVLKSHLSHDPQSTPVVTMWNKIFTECTFSHLHSHNVVSKQLHIYT